MTTALTPRRAYDLQVEIVADCSTLRRSWARLAGNLHEFHASRGWEALGQDTFNEWLAQPEVGMKRRQAYLLIQAWEELVVERGVQPAALEAVDVTKVEVVLPALRRGEVDTDQALADVEVLSRSDLREKYRGEPHQHDGQSMEACPDCGRMRRAA